MDIDLLSRAKKIKLVAFDCDGVMTDGKLTFDDTGKELKSFNVKDGLGMVMLVRNGIKTSIITARTSKVLEIRANMVEVSKLYQGQKNKLETLEEVQKEFNVSLDEIAYMGDDLIDLCILNRVGLASCPKDAVDEVREACHFVSSKDGGNGAVRELCDLILKVNSVKFEVK